MASVERDAPFASSPASTSEPTPTPTKRPLMEIPENHQAILGLSSLLIWLVVVFAIILRFNLDNGPQPFLLVAGFTALAISALPWLAYLLWTRRRAA